MVRAGLAVACLTLVACSGPEPGAHPETRVSPGAVQAPVPEPTPTIDAPIDSVPAEKREVLLQAAVAKVADEYRADWMLTETAGSQAMWQHAVKIYESGRTGLTFHGLIKEAFQVTREDFLNRAEVAKTSADTLARAQVEAARNRQISRMLREQEILVERERAAQQAALEAQAKAAARAEAAYADAVYQQQVQQARQAGQAYQRSRAMPVNPSRFDPENVGFDSRHGYTAARYGSRDRARGTREQTAPRRFQDQYGNWYEQPPGSGFARDERTGKQCVVSGATVQCN